MFGLPYRPKEFCIVPPNPKTILKICRVDENVVSDDTAFAKLLTEYIAGVSAKSVVIEHAYIDKDYLEDYASYYARCFKDYKRRCKRVHFFRKVLSARELESIIVDKDMSRAQELNNAYLGFIVVRPLQKTVVGRTCLEPYPQGNSGRRYPALCKVPVSLFGIRLTVNCMPFQEQDSNVAACATCALWSALYVAAERFGCQIHSPSYITTSAMAHGLSSAREFPNNGIYEEDMIYAIRRAGLDPVVVDFDEVSAIMLANKFLGNIYAYLKLHIAVIVIVNIKDKNDESMGYHAITVNGYHIDAAVFNGTKRGNGLFACGIDKLYANDDQMVAYSRINVSKKSDGLELISNWRDKIDRNWCCRFEPVSLIIPVYCKIRVTYEDVWDVANEFDRMIKACRRLMSSDYVEWDIYLNASNDFKDDIRKDKRLSDTDKLRFLKSNLPRYLWNVGVKINNCEVALLCIDATDSGQGLQVVGSLFYTGDMIRLAKKVSKIRGDAKDNILCSACLS